MTRTPALGRRVAHSWKVIAAVAAVLCADSSSAGVREAFSGGIRKFTLDVENDSFLTTDHFYTNGLRLAYRLTEREVLLAPPPPPPQAASVLHNATRRRSFPCMVRPCSCYGRESALDCAGQYKQLLSPFNSGAWTVC